MSKPECLNSRRTDAGQLHCMQGWGGWACLSLDVSPLALHPRQVSLGCFARCACDARLLLQLLRRCGYPLRPAWQLSSMQLPLASIWLCRAGRRHLRSVPTWLIAYFR